MLENEIIKAETFCGNAMVDKGLSILGIEHHQISELPVVALVGESKAAKSTIVAKKVDPAYYNGMMILTGKGSTTHCETYTVIDPASTKASLCICIKSEEQVRDFLLMNFKSSMVKGLKSILSSMPKDSLASEQFLNKAVEDRLADEDAKFRVSKLLRGERSARYSELMRKLLGYFIHYADSTFKNTYFDTKKESEKDANMMLSILVDQVLTLADDSTEFDRAPNLSNQDDLHDKVIPEMIKLIIDEGYGCLKDSLFLPSIDEGIYDNFNGDLPSISKIWYRKDMLSDEFEAIIKKITNSKEYDEQSIACLIDTIIIKVPGKGLEIRGANEYQPYLNNDKAYIIGDFIGFSNDGLENVGMITRKAMLETVKYDVVIYVGKITTIPAVHTSYMKLIFETIRPAKLIIALTFCDKDDIFDTDDEVEEITIRKMIHERKNEFLDLIKGIGVTDAPIIMPKQEDIICLANIVPKRLGEAAERIFKSEEPYNMLRSSIANGYEHVRKRIHINGISENSIFMKPSIVIEGSIGDTISKLTEIINEELNDLKARSNGIHHWTLDAILLKCLDANEHVSNAHKWDNVHISIYTNIRQVLLESYGPIKFDGAFNISNEKDSDRIRKEFHANLVTELSKASVLLILMNSDNTMEKSECYQKIRALARRPKYNKWLIFEELRKALLNAVTQNAYLVRILNDAFENACHITYRRILL